MHWIERMAKLNTPRAELPGEGECALENLRAHVGANYHVDHRQAGNIHCVAVIRESDGAVVAISMLPGFAWAVSDARGAFDKVTR